ncbi:MAG: hypothetical protein ABI983_03355 [Acidobacteriota bacterium]
MSNRRARVIVFWLFTIGCVAGAIGYVRWRPVPHAQPPVSSAGASSPAVSLLDPANASVRATIDTLRTSPHITFLSTRTDAPGHIGFAALDKPEAVSIIDGPECERSHFGKDLGLCLALNRESMEPRAFALILDNHFQPLARFPMAGLPIRARVSRDQRYAAATVFVTGENYSSDFTTRTTIIDLAARRPIATLEEFTVERDGRPYHAVDFNFWGVTFFQDGNRFYATLGTGGKRLLVEGNIARKQMRVAGTDVECPSLSPDERHIVFKRKLSTGPGWGLWAKNLSSGEAWAITDEGQDIDDQVEWLDNEHVVYGRLFGHGAPETSLSLWTSRIARQPTFDQQLFLRSASSPSVIR